MNTIEWKEQYDNFGLDFSTKTGKWEDYTFDIRYDYEGNPKLKPDCHLFLIIYKKGQRISNNVFSKSIETLTNEALLFMQDEQRKFLKADFSS